MYVTSHICTYMHMYLIIKAMYATPSGDAAETVEPQQGSSTSSNHIAANDAGAPDSWNQILQNSGHDVDQACRDLLTVVVEKRGESAARILESIWERSKRREREKDRER
jgi:hypothetical protein